MKKLLLLNLLLCCSAASSLAVVQTAQTLQITPQPREVVMNNALNKSYLRVKGAGFNYSSSLEQRTIRAIAKLCDDISAATGRTSSFAAVVGVTSSVPASSLKGFYFLEDKSLPAENYVLEITGRSAKVTASDHNGFFYAIQTLRQMLPVGNYLGKSGGRWRLPQCVISDGPRFAYRGMHLDPCRHFWSVEQTKKYLDVMAVYKLNRLHWHLTEDQGWRIEIKKYPELTDIGAFRNGTMIGHDFSSNDGVRYGGFYTKEQIRELVEYAWERGITIIPEVDLPGHMVAALTAYPRLGCTGGPYSVWTRWGVSEDVLCVGKESTFEFLEGVLDEVCELFPSEYIHIGGDECPKVRWEKCPHCQAMADKLGLVFDEKGTREQKLQNYTTARVQEYLAGKGRKIIGWDEILEGELAPGATVMSWRGTSGGIEAANKGFDVIMTPNSHFYFDYQQGEIDKEPLGPRYIKNPLTLEKVYSFDPYKGINAEQQKHILGVQANLWTEYIATPEHLEYMLLPRMLALSEVQWTPASERNYNRFLETLKNHQEAILSELGYNYRLSSTDALGQEATASFQTSE
jgi:hexosaminidase